MEKKQKTKISDTSYKTIIPAKVSNYNRNKNSIHKSKSEINKLGENYMLQNK